MSSNTVVAYYRLSTERQGKKGLGIDVQKYNILKFCIDNNYKIIGEFQDIKSGANADREGLKNAIELNIETNSILMIYTLDRLTRDSEFYTHQINDKINYLSLDNPTRDQKISEILISTAQEEREIGSKRTKEALAAKKARGEHVGRSKGTIYKNQAILSANLGKMHHDKHLERLNEQPDLITLLESNYHLYTNAITKKVQEAGYTNKQGKPPSSTTVAKWIEHLKIKERVEYKLAHPSPTLVLTKTNYTIEEMKKLIAEQEKNK